MKKYGGLYGKQRSQLLNYLKNIKESIESELHSRRQSEQFSSAHEVASLNKSFLSSLINLIKVMVTPPNQK